MKKLLPLFLLIVWTAASKAQMVSQVVSIQPGYTNQAFYSMNNGIVSNVNNTDWDLAFQIRGFAASILINSKNNVRLWNANKSVAQWSSMTSADTTGIINNPTYELFNADTSWDFGAFNRTNDTSNAFDLGWGLYDQLTHAITGDSVYYIKVGASDYRKIMIVSLSGGVYTFKFANVDGSNEITSTLAKSNFTGKFFGYYSIVNNVFVAREPDYNTWDLTFCQYLATDPILYKVSGVLSNDSVFVAKAYPVDTVISSAAGFTFSEKINAIGYDWKAFDLNSNSWLISDSLVYFVTDRSGNTWKMVFTGFDGSSTGNYFFYKGPATPTGLFENSPVKTFGIYPNPAADFAAMILKAASASPSVIRLVDMNGRTVHQFDASLSAGVQRINIDLISCTAGLYQVIVQQGSQFQVSRLIVE